jgi:fructose-1,6-bisphosphatase
VIENKMYSGRDLLDIFEQYLDQSCAHWRFLQAFIKGFIKKTLGMK